MINSLKLRKLNKITKFIILNLVMAITYIIGIQISHQFTTLQGEVASVWFSSAITLPMVFFYNLKILPGIVIGSILGLIPAIAKMNPPLSLMDNIILNLACIFGNCLQPLFARYFIKKFIPDNNIFIYLYSTWIFIFVGIFAPIISALIGVSTLLLINIITIDEYGISLLTWWLASALAHIIFSPLLIIAKEKNILSQKVKFGETIIILLILSFLCIIIFKFAYPLEYLLLPILIWSVCRLNRWTSNLLITFIAFIAIFSTAKGYGIFVRDTVNESLLLLQSFTAVFSLTGLTLSAVLSEKKMAQLSLQQSLETLEIKVLERTKELIQTKEKLENVNQALEEMVNTDGLTQISNRRHFDEHLHNEWKHLQELQKPLTLLLMDVDYFKLYNDTYGHIQGDQCLITIAKALKSQAIRASDLAARYGGEEFVILLPCTDIAGGITVAKKIQTIIKELAIVHKTAINNNIVTLSIGIASLIPNMTDYPSILVKQADKALYLAKEKGRNNFVVYTTLESRE